MLKIYLLIELLSGVSAVSTLDALRALEMAPARLENAVELADDKIVAFITAPDRDAASRAVLQHIAATKGVVQVNLIATVHPRGSGDVR
jgi:hypothetical protein